MTCYLEWKCWLVSLSLARDGILYLNVRGMKSPEDEVVVHSKMSCLCDDLVLNLVHLFRCLICPVVSFDQTPVKLMTFISV